MGRVVREVLTINDLRSDRNQFAGGAQSCPSMSKMPEETPKLFDAFISYSSHDSDVATRLEEGLKQEGFEVWLDKREVLVGHNIVDRVSLGLSDSRFVILLLSSSSVQSEWVKSEWTAAYVTEIESKKCCNLTCASRAV